MPGTARADQSRGLDVVIIGAGIVGLATAWKLISRYPRLSLAVLDKETKEIGRASCRERVSDYV